MKVDLDNAIIMLGRFQLIRLRGARGVRLTCHAGTLWMTQEGMARDDFLVPGGSREIESDGVVVVEAMGDASVSIDTGTLRNRAVSAQVQQRVAAGIRETRLFSPVT